MVVPIVLTMIVVRMPFFFGVLVLDVIHAADGALSWFFTTRPSAVHGADIG
jgi:hypothetical protein